MSFTDNFIAFWKLGEASGTRVDSIGSNDLTDNNTVTQAAGKIGNCAQFTAANSEYLSIADNAALSTGDIDFSIVFWVYFDSTPSFADVIAKWAAGEQEYVVEFGSNTPSGMTRKFCKPSHS